VYVVPLASRRPALSAAADAGTPSGELAGVPPALRIPHSASRLLLSAFRTPHSTLRTAPCQLAIKTSGDDFIWT